MKKLIVAAAIVCVSVVAQAATYSWKAYNDWYSPDGNDDLAGKVYLFDGSIYAQDAMIASIASGNLDGLANNIASTALGAGGFLLTGTGLTDDGAATPYAHMYAIIMNDGNTEYFASEVVNTKISDAIVGGAQAQFSFAYNDSVAMSPVGAPEPTSGLLLLLGMAGLALRRKRA